MSQQWPGTPVGGAMPAAPQPAAPPPFIQGTVSPTKQAAEVRAQSGEVRAQQDQALQMQKFQLDQEKAARDQKKDAGGTVDEKKVATLTTRLAGSFNDINSIRKNDPSAQEPGFIETVRGGLSPGGLSGIPARKLAGQNRRMIYDAEMDALDALLTLGTGAAYTPAQLEGQRASYFPQYGDSEAEIAAKNQRFQRLIEAAKANAGPAWANVEPQIAEFMKGVPKAPAPNAPPANPNGYYDEQSNTVVGSTVDGNSPGYMQIAAGFGDILQGVGDTLGIVGNPLNATINAVAGTNLSTDLGQVLRDASGLPKGDPTVGAINRAATGGLLTGGLSGLAGKAGSIPVMARNALAQYGATPVADAVVSGTAAASGEAAKSAGAGPVGQTLATLAGGAAPAGMMGGLNALARNRGGGAVPPGGGNVVAAGERQAVPIRRPDYDLAARPKRAQLEKSDKGGPIVRSADQADMQAMETAVNRVGGQGRPAANSYELGDRVQTALIRHKDETKKSANTHYTRAEKLSGNQVIAPEGTLAQLTDAIDTLKAEGANTNAAEIKVLEGLRSDLSTPGGKPISSLRAIRTNIRTRIRESNLSFTPAETRVMDIVGGISGDIEKGLSGNPRALQQYKAGDKIWRERAQFRSEITSKLMGPDGKRSPIETARALEGFVKSNPGALKRVRDIMEPDEADDLAASVAANLGRNRKGEFSPAALLDHLDSRNGRVSPQAVRELFGNDGVEALGDLKILARAKIDAKADTAPSGAAIQSAKRGLRSMLFMTLGLSQGGIGGAAAAPLVDNFFSSLGEARAARLLMNPVMTKALRKTPESTNPEVINRWFANLSKSAAKSPVFAADLEAFKQSLVGAANRSTTAAAATGEQEQN